MIRKAQRAVKPSGSTSKRSKRRAKRGEQSNWDWWLKGEPGATPPTGKKAARLGLDPAAPPPPPSKWERRWERYGSGRSRWVGGQRGTVPPEPSDPPKKTRRKGASKASRQADSTDEGAAHWTGPAPAAKRTGQPKGDPPPYRRGPATAPAPFADEGMGFDTGPAPAPDRGDRNPRGPAGPYRRNTPTAGSTAVAQRQESNPMSATQNAIDYRTGHSQTPRQATRDVVLAHLEEQESGARANAAQHEEEEGSARREGESLANEGDGEAAAAWFALADRIRADKEREIGRAQGYAKQKGEVATRA